MNLRSQCLPIRMLLLDVDGVLTDGGVTFNASGEPLTEFDIQDGLGMRLWREAGHLLGIVTGRSSDAVRRRAGQLAITIFHDGVADKWHTVRSICDDTKMSPAQVCYVGDDLPDLPVIRRVGLGVAVANARQEVRQSADWVTRHPGGSGAVREVIETLLKHQGRWGDVVTRATATQTADL
ncbi:MAG: HAD-IIIA family hydrolase [Planctomycetales bacterium]|nr:HAD-IIIA family hydrolase [Planctomycetales bacterium]